MDSKKTNTVSITNIKREEEIGPPPPSFNCKEQMSLEKALIDLFSSFKKDQTLIYHLSIFDSKECYALACKNLFLNRSEDVNSEHFYSLSKKEFNVSDLMDIPEKLRSKIKFLVAHNVILSEQLSITLSVKVNFDDNQLLILK